MFTINSIYLNYPFSKHLWWKQEYAQFVVDHLLNMLLLLKKSIMDMKKNQENEIWLKEYSDYYKQMYSIEILVGEKNITQTDFDYYNQQKFDRISSRSMIKIENMNSAVDYLFPGIFRCELSPNDFNENLAIEMNRIIGKDLFEQRGTYRINEAMASQENYRYLASNQIQVEMKKLFDFTREKFIQFKELESPAEQLIKLGTQFLVHFLAIHPFQNGNGRVARLLLSYLLTSVTIVPLSIYSKNENARDVYLNCITDEQRYKSPATESNMASLILESAFMNLETICINLDIYPSTE